MANPPVRLSKAQRKCVEAAIKESAAYRGRDVYALNARSNHVHVVVRITSGKPPSIALNAFKANGTRALREAGLYKLERTPWADKGSERWLWTDKQVAAAIDYVLYSQGDDFLLGD